jgi:CheY-like chemotaxis protein
VRLPIGKPPSPSNVVRLDSMQPAKLRVVLVEDNADLRDLTRELLEAYGCSVELASDGQEGLDRILASKPDLALVDIGLPVMDGYAVAREARRQLGSEVVLVAASGYGLEQDREEARRSGFDLHVTKPLDANAIAEVLALAQSERSRRATQSSAR